MGGSHGGSTVLASLVAPGNQKDLFAAAVALYSAVQLPASHHIEQHGAIDNWA